MGSTGLGLTWCIETEDTSMVSYRLYGGATEGAAQKFKLLAEVVKIYMSLVRHTMS
jgi:hypothetical protein